MHYFYIQCLYNEYTDITVPTQTAPRAVSASVCKPVAASTVEVPDDERHNARNMLNY